MTHLKECKNKDCKKVLPEGYKYKYCERCRKKRSDTVKKTLVAIPVVALSAIAAVPKVLKFIVFRR